MSVKASEIEEQLDKAIQATDDPKDRAMLMLIQKILLHVEKLLDDEESLRIKVFNGNYINHTVDHDFVEDLRALNAIETVKWVNTRMALGGQCPWSAKKIEEEKESGKKWKEKTSDLVFELAKNGIYVIFGMAVYALATGFPLLSKIIG